MVSSPKSHRVDTFSIQRGQGRGRHVQGTVTGVTDPRVAGRVINPHLGIRAPGTGGLPQQEAAGSSKFVRVAGRACQQKTLHNLGGTSAFNRPLSVLQHQVSLAHVMIGHSHRPASGQLGTGTSAQPHSRQQRGFNQAAA